MSIINRLASQLQRRDEKPNIQLAHELVKNHDLEGIQEVIQNLSHDDKRIQQDCIKVVYEIGKINPELISEYSLTFIHLLKSRHNRLIWGAMQALSTVAIISAPTLMKQIDIMMRTIKRGSVITVDKGILTLAKLASVSRENNDRIFPFLLRHLETCRSKDIPQHAESILMAVTEDNQEVFLEVLKRREIELTPPRLKRIENIYKSFK